MSVRGEGVRGDGEIWESVGAPSEGVRVRTVPTARYVVNSRGTERQGASKMSRKCHPNQNAV